MRLPSKIPHLISDDSKLLLQYLSANPELYDLLEYDVPVGDGRDPGPDFDTSIRTMAIQLSRRRIDCVAHASNYIEIIEVTQSAGLTALGQLHAYPVLYRLTYAPAKEIRTAILCRSIQSDMEDSIRAASARIIILPE
jgi:hypothetical protein